MTSENARVNWFERNPRKTKTIICLFSLAFLELLVRLIVAAGLLPLRYYPVTHDPQFWAYTDESVGMWKVPDTQFKHESSCFSVIYESNNMGARDIERNSSADGKHRTLVLGDSFVEGWGVSAEQRFSNLLEQRTGDEHMNFGASGGFGTIKEWLLYEKWGGVYEHSEVMLFVLPYNDFDDNNPKSYSSDLYRPYLRDGQNGPEVYYPVEFDSRDTERRSTGKVIRNRIYMGSHLINILISGIKAIDINKEVRIPVSRYLSYTEAELETMLYTLRQIRDLAGDRPFSIFLIPRGYDIEMAAEREQPAPLVLAMQQFADANENTWFTDLLPVFAADAKTHQRTAADYTLGCDGHWSGLGHDIAANAVLDASRTRAGQQ
jgi:hypothetical protein